MFKSLRKKIDDLGLSVENTGIPLWMAHTVTAKVV